MAFDRRNFRRGPPSEASNEAASKITKSKLWMNKAKAHMNYMPATLADMTSSAASSGHLIIIKTVSIGGASKICQDRHKYYLKLHFTLFNRKHMEFFGRTYISVDRLLVRRGDQLVFEEPEFIFLHSNYTDATAVESIIEICLVEKEEATNAIKKHFSIGFAPCKPYSEGDSSATVFEGSCRQLNSSKKIVPKANKQVTVAYRSQRIDTLAGIMRLIPMNMPTGHADQIPGLVGGYIPRNPSQNPMHEISPTSDVFVSGIKILNCGGAKEQKLIARMRDQLMAEGGGAGQTAKIDVHRKLCVGAHNQWHFTNVNGLSNSIALMMRDRDLEAGGVIKVDNVYMDKDIGIVMQLEYSITITPPHGRPWVKRLILGWFVALPTVSRDGFITDMKIYDPLFVGPGKNPFGESLWDPRDADSRTPSLATGASEMDENRIFIQANISKSEFFQGNYRQPMEAKQPGHQHMPPPEQHEVSKINYEEQRKREAEQLKFSEQLTSVQQGKFDEMNRQNELQRTHLERDRKERENELMEQRYKMAELERQLAEAKVERERAQEAPRGTVGTPPPQTAPPAPDPHFIPPAVAHPPPSTAQTQPSPAYATLPTGPVQYMTPEEDKMREQKALEGIAYTGEQEPPSGIRDMSRADQAFLISRGQTHLLDSQAKYRKQAMINMEVEEKDPLKASTIIIDLLGWKTEKQLFDNKRVPKRLYFGVNFFTFPLFITEAAKLTSDQEHLLTQYGILHELKRDGPVALTNRKSTAFDNTTLLQLKYDIDPSIKGSEDISQFLAHYLRFKCIFIEIYDAASMLHIGTARFPLVELLRQGKPLVSLKKEAPVYDLKGGRVGSLLVMLKNMGRAVEVIGHDKQKMAASGMSMGMHKSKSGKVKIKSNPINLMDSDTLNKVIKGKTVGLSGTGGTNDELRKQARVNRFKTSFLKPENMNKLTSEVEPDWVKQKSLKDIQILRDAQRPEILRKVMNQYSTTHETLPYLVGQPSFKKLEIVNPFDREELFSIVISDPLNKQEVKIISDQTEWRMSCTQGGYPRPPDFGMITEGNRLMLRRYEKVTVVLKVHCIEGENTEETAQGGHQDDRVVQVYVYQSNGSPHIVHEYYLIKQPTFMDNIYRFDKPENLPTKITIPNPSREGISLGSEKVYLLCTNKDAVTTWLPNLDLSVNVGVPRAPENLKFLIFGYSDTFHHELDFVLKVEIQAYIPYPIRIKCGQPFSCNLSFQGDKGRSVIVHSAQPVEVKPAGSAEKALTVYGEKMMNIPMDIRIFNPGNFDCKVHCIDANTSELVHGWLLQIQSEKPDISKIFKAACHIGEPSRQQFSYTNNSSQWRLIDFVSSNPELMQISDGTQGFNEKETKNIPTYFPPSNRRGTAEIMVFVTDRENKIFESFICELQEKTGLADNQILNYPKIPPIKIQIYTCPQQQ